jgi:flagellar motor switch protein FliN
MTPSDTRQAHSIVKQWGSEFTNVMEAMADLRVETHIDSNPPETAELLWWGQDFDLVPGASIWIGAIEETWTALGKLVLAAAGVDSGSAEELKGTYLEVIRQSLSAVGTALSAQAGRQISATEGAEHAPPERGVDCRLILTAGEQTFSGILFHISDELLDALLPSRPGAEAVEDRAPSPKDDDADEGDALSARACGTLNLLMDVEMPVSVSFGRTQVRMQDIVKLITGSIIELDRSISEPVEVIVNNCVIARGEVVVVDGNYGVRISEVMSRRERLQESRKYLLPLSHR